MSEQPEMCSVDGCSSLVIAWTDENGRPYCDRCKTDVERMPSRWDKRFSVVSDHDGPPFDDGTRKAMMNAALRLADTLDAEHGRVTNAGSTIRRLVKHLHRERAEVDRFKRADKIMADALLKRERTVQQARAWWNSQGRFLVPREGDGDAWDEYTRRPVPEWVSDSPRSLHNARRPHAARSRDSQMLTTSKEIRPMNDDRTFYGPHACAICGMMIVRASHQQGGEAFDQPDVPIYPNTKWKRHACSTLADSPPSSR